MTFVRRLLRRSAAQDGHSLTELLTVLAILGTVLAGLTGLFVSASGAEVEMNERFGAQQNARLALTKMRRDVHCASSATVTAAGTGARVTLTFPATPVGGCGTTAVSWCTVEVTAGRFGLFRSAGSTCDATGVRVADHLTIGNAFAYTQRKPSSLATLNVDFAVDANLKDTRAAYRLQDALALRRSGRA